MHTHLYRTAPQPAGAPLPAPLDRASLRQAGAGLAAGGLLLLVMYAVEIVYGLRHGRLYLPEDVPASSLARGGLALLTLGLLVVAVGLFRLGLAVRPKAALPGLLGMALASVAFVLMPLNLAFLLGAFGPPRHLPALMLPILANLAATILLSIPVLRMRLMPARLGLALLAAGVVTFPFILLTIPLEAFVPDYVIADLPFAAWGATLVAVGWLIWRRPA